MARARQAAVASGAASTAGAAAGMTAASGAAALNSRGIEEHLPSKQLPQDERRLQFPQVTWQPGRCQRGSCLSHGAKPEGLMSQPPLKEKRAAEVLKKRTKQEQALEHIEATQQRSLHLPWDRRPGPSPLPRC